MDKMIIIDTRFTKEEKEELSEFVVSVNSNVETSSMYCSNKKNCVLKEIEKCEKDKTIAVAKVNNEIVGVCTVFINDDVADTNLIISKKCDNIYDEIADALLQKIKDNTIKDLQFGFFFPYQNVRLASYLKKNNAVQKVNEYYLFLEKKNMKNLEEKYHVTKLEQVDNVQFITLLNDVFPDCYISPEDIISSKIRDVYVIKENNIITAFGVLERKSETNVCTEIVIVKEGYRHLGRGRTILSHLIKESFKNDEVKTVDLIVDSDNENALKLYFDLGYQIKYVNNYFLL